MNIKNLSYFCAITLFMGQSCGETPRIAIEAQESSDQVDDKFLTTLFSPKTESLAFGAQIKAMSAKRKRSLAQKLLELPEPGRAEKFQKVTGNGHISADDRQIFFDVAAEKFNEEYVANLKIVNNLTHGHMKTLSSAMVLAVDGQNVGFVKGLYESTHGKDSFINGLLKMPINEYSFPVFKKLSVVDKEVFLSYLLSEGTENIFNILLKPGRKDNSACFASLVNLIIQTLKNAGKKDQILINGNNLIKLLEIKGNLNSESLSLIFEKVLEHKDKRATLYQWVGKNLEKNEVRVIFREHYATLKDVEKQAVQSGLLFGLKEQFGSQKFRELLEVHAASLGLKDLLNLRFNTAGIINGLGASVTFHQLKAQPAANFLPSIKARQLAPLALAAQKNVDAQEKAFSRLKLNPVANGLRNVTGSSCYLNSITQTLLHTPEINRLLSYLNSGKALFKDRPTPLLDLLAKVSAGYRKGEEADNREWTELAIKTTGIGAGQQDASDFFDMLLGQFNQELGSPGKLPEYTLKDHEQSDLAFIESYDRANEYSLLEKWLKGYLREEKTYTDSTKGVSFSKVINLELDFRLENGELEPNLSLEKMIANYFAPIAYKEGIVSEKNRSMVVAPTILKIRLKRFDWVEQRKITDPVTYPEELKLMANGKEVTYNLYSVVQHGGELGGGHYWADIKAADGKWYEVNDNVHTLTTLKDALSHHEGAYVLFYRVQQ